MQVFKNSSCHANIGNALISVARLRLIQGEKMPARPAHQPRPHLARNILVAAAAGFGLSARYADAMTFNLTFDSTVTSLPYAAQAEAATSYAAQTISSLFSDNININVNVVS